MPAASSWRRGFTACCCLALFHAAAASAAVQSPAVDPPIPPPGPTLTIQTGTFVPPEPATRQAETLGERLAPPLVNTLRVERGDTYHIVRTGLFQTMPEARAALRIIRSIVPDAFILNEPPETADRLVYLFPADDSPGQRFIVRTGTFTERYAAVSQAQGLAAGLDAPLAETIGVWESNGGFVVGFGPSNTLGEAWTAFRGIVHTFPESRVVPEATVVAGAPVSTQPNGDDPQNADTTPGVSAVPSNDEAPLPEPTGPPMAEIVDEMTTLLSEERFEDALRLLDEAVAEWPDNPDLRAWQGSALMSAGEAAGALDAFRHAAELAPDVPDYRSAAGYSLIQIYRENLLQAVEEFGSALDLDPDNPQALEGLGSVLTSMGEADRAREVEARLREVDPEAADRLAELIQYGIDWTP